MSEEKQVEKHGRWLLPSILLILGFFLLYCLFHTETGYFTRDPLLYYTSIEEGSLRSLFFDPKHLLYPPLGYVVYLLWKWAGWTQGPQLPLQMLSVLAGALGVGLFFWLVSNVTQDTRISLLASCLLAFSYGYWRYTLEATSYPLTTLGMTCFLLVATRIKSHPSIGLSGLLSLVNGITTLFLQSGLLLVPSALVSFVFTEIPWAEKVKKSGIYLASLAFVVGILYTIVVLVLLRLRAIEDLRSYLLGDALASSWYGFGNLSAITPLKALIGFGNLWVGEVFALDFVSSTPSLRSAVVSQMPDVALPPVFWVSSNSLRFIICSFLTIIVAVAMVLFLTCLIRYWRRLWRSHKELLVICLAWIIPFSAFGLYLRPENVHAWIPVLVPVCLILALVLQDARRNANLCTLLSPKGQEILVILVVIALFSLNFFGSILPAHNPNSNWNLRMSLLLRNQASADDLVIPLEAGEFRHLPPHLLYYIGSQVIPIRGSLLGGYSGDYIDRKIQEKLSSGNRVFVLFDVFDSKLGYAHIARASGMTEDEIGEKLADFFAKYELVAVVREGDQPLVYEITALK